MSDQDQPERAIRMRRNHQLTRDRVPIHGDPGVTDIALGSTPVRVDQRDAAQPRDSESVEDVSRQDGQGGAGIRERHDRF